MAVNPAPREFSKQELADDLRRIGIKAGDKLMVHSSLKSLGRVQGGPQAVVRALQEVLTPDGTLMMPSFNHGHPWEAGGEGFYDPLRTPTSNGAIPDAFWRTSGVRRSLDPTHPVACWGKDALQYTQFHHRTLTMGEQSPLGLLARDGGMALMLGVGYKPNTYHHVVEMMLAAPCLGRRTEAYPVHLADGRIVMGRTWGWRERACPINDSILYARFMTDRQMTGPIGACQAILFRLSDAREVISRVLEQGIDGLPPCSRCPIRPRKDPHTIESDWDDARNCLKDDSVAWTY